MKCMKKYADGGAWPPGKPKMDKSCKGPKAWGGGQPDNSPGQSRSGQQAGQGPKVSFDSSRMVSQKEIERRARKKKNEGMTIGQRVMRNAQEKKNKKAAEAAAKQQRYAGPRFL
jgi:hypothetical protein